MPFDLSPPPKLRLPERPAIVRAADPWKTPVEDARIRLGALPGLAPTPCFPAAAVGVTPTYRTYVLDSANAASYTFTDLDVGTATNTLVIVAIHVGGNGADITAVTIGGTAASYLNAPVNNTTQTAIAARRFTPGGLISIAITLDAAANRCAIGLWTATGIASATPASQDGETYEPPASPAQVDLTVPSGGFAIIAGSRGSTTAITTTGATERYDNSAESTHRYVGADTTAGGAISVQMTASVRNIVGATWGP